MKKARAGCQAVRIAKVAAELRVGKAQSLTPTDPLPPLLGLLSPSSAQRASPRPVLIRGSSLAERAVGCSRTAVSPVEKPA